MMSDGYTNPLSLPPTPDGWNVVAIEDICQNVTSGGTPLRSNQSFYQGGMHSWFKTQELKDSILYESEEKITDKALELSSAKLFPKGTVLMAMYGDGKTITSLGILSKEAATNQACCAMIPNPNLCDSRFLFYALKYHRDDFIQIASGGAQRNLSGKLIRCFALNIPPLPEQRAIDHILGTLDDKIELNRRMNETLEAMARAIFKSWFVDFDPVRAKAEGRDTGLPEEIADLFPDSFEETELGEVPKGWKHYSAETVAEVGIGKTPPRKESEWFSTNPDDIRWVSIRDMGESGTHILDTTEYLPSEAVNKFNIRVVPDNTVLLSFKLTIGRVSLTDGEMITNEAIAHFKLFEEFHLSSEYLYLYLQNFDYAKLGSTSSIAQAVNSKTIKAMPILVPEKNVIKEFTNNFVRIFEMIKMNQKESRTLAKLRDTLLPKLISGELRIDNTV